MIAITRTVSERLAEWVSSLTPESFPDDVRDATINSLMDVFGLCIAARAEPYTRAALASWDAEGASNVIGMDRTLDPCGAALVNGVAAHGEDFDNTFEGCPVHSGAVIVPAVLAIAQRERLDGASALTAMVVGVELMCRMGLVARKSMHAAGFHPTAIIGAMAATAAVGKVLRLSEAEMVDSFGVAGSMASGIIEYLADGSWTKRMHAGWAAQSGIRAAQMGRSGFVGPRTVFEGEHGLFRSFAPSLAPDWAPLIEDLGSRWETANVAFKPFACGTMTQPYVDCAIALRADGIEAEDIVEIVCQVGEGTVHRLWEPLLSKQRPPNGYAAKFSTPYCVAVGLIDGDAGLHQFTSERIEDSRILALAAKVTYQVDPANEYPANYSGHVRALLKNGAMLEKSQATLRGGIKQPMSRGELVVKYRRNAAYGGWSPQAAEALLEIALRFAELDDVSTIGHALRTRAA